MKQNVLLHMEKFPKMPHGCDMQYKKWNLPKLIGVIPCADAGFCNAAVENRVAHVAIQFVSTRFRWENPVETSHHPIINL